MSVVRCSGCYEDHSAEVTYDAASRRSWIFCPKAGRVEIDDAALATLHLDTRWLPDQLARALCVALRPPRLTLVEGAAWLLGDTVVGSTKVSVALAVGIRGTSEVDQLIAGLGRRKVLELGVLLFAGCQLPEYVGAVSRYAAVSLDQLAYIEDGWIRVEQGRLSAWIRGLLQGEMRPVKTGRGRLSKDGQVLAIFEGRRRRGERYESKNAESAAILSEWLSLYPDEKPPGHSTVRKHLPESKRDALPFIGCRR